MISFMGAFQFILTGALTLGASRILHYYQASDDIAQWVYPSVAVFSLWFSSFITKRENNKELQGKIRLERDKWKGICCEIKQAKDYCIEKIIQHESSSSKRNELLIRDEINRALVELTANETKILRLVAKEEALLEKNKELIRDLEIKEEHIDYILESRTSLERKVSEFINQLRGFHQEINRELKDTSSKNSAMWKSIDALADKIYQEIKVFNDYISTALIDERLVNRPKNRKTNNQTLDLNFSAPKVEYEKSPDNKKKQVV
ncbi:TPA: hypothetical protein SIJ95_001562 [Escherichia coli]|nr:hypothetical protein [Escherichia coli]